MRYLSDIPTRGPPPMPSQGHTRMHPPLPMPSQAYASMHPPHTHPGHMHPLHMNPPHTHPMHMHPPHMRPPPQHPPSPPPPKHESITRAFYEHSSAPRIFTDTVIIDALEKAYPGLEVTIIPHVQYGVVCDLLNWAAAGNATAIPVDESVKNPLTRRMFIPGLRRTDPPVVTDELLFGKYMYTYKGHEFVLYYANGSNTPDSSYDRQINQYLVGAPKHVADELLVAITSYALELHDEIWVFDGGYWDKSAELYKSIDKASWDDVILESKMKEAVQDDVTRFFASEERYKKLKVPWKRGIIFYGPPGNGKTVSIKATMHTLYNLKVPVPCLYVRSLKSFMGDEYSIMAIFSLARQKAPCLLIFEDLDSLVGDDSRSYFLNEVDGLQNNDGVLMIGSTNHLDRLDPGISKRPSRFDRKYEFPKPDFDQRVKYCEYWRGKLAENKEIDFPKKLCKAIAEITDEFSFAYIQEAFVASLLSIASREEGKSKGKVSGSSDDDLDGLILWQEIQKQVKILRSEM